MATSKQQAKELDSASDCFDTVCQPCSLAGRSSIANMFCVECQEYLCTNCTTCHRTFKMSRSHALVTLDDVSKNPSVKIDKCSKKCTIHKGKTVKYFCSTHSVFGCSVCANTDHKPCSDVHYIPTIAEKLESNSEFKHFNEYLTSLDTAATQLTADIEHTLVQLKAEPKQIQEAIQLVKNDVIAKLDDLGKKLVSQAESVNREQTKKIQALLQTFQATKLSVREFKNETDTLINKKHNCDAYVLMKTHFSELQTLRNKIEEAIKTSVKHAVFRPKAFQVVNLGDLDTQEAQVGSHINLPNDDSGPKESIQAQVGSNINLPNDDSGPKESIQAHSGTGTASTKSRQTLDGRATARGLRVGSRVQVKAEWRRAVSKGGPGTVVAIPPDMSTYTVKVTWDKTGKNGGIFYGAFLCIPYSVTGGGPGTVVAIRQDTSNWQQLTVTWDRTGRTKEYYEDYLELIK